MERRKLAEKTDDLKDTSGFEVERQVKYRCTQTTRLVVVGEDRKGRRMHRFQDRQLKTKPQTFLTRR
jgi:hypothetical protein